MTCSCAEPPSRLWVNFVATLATNVVVVDSAHLTAQSPAHAAGAVNIGVTVPPGVSGAPATSAFTFLEAPTLTSVSPVAGTGAGGTAVTLTGTNFFPGAVVYFGGVPATGVNVIDASTVTAITPAHAPGLVEVVVTNPDGQSGGWTMDSPSWRRRVWRASLRAPDQPREGPRSL